MFRREIVFLLLLINHGTFRMQGMYALGNVASGNEFHKEAVMHQLLPQIGDTTQLIIIKHLQNNDSRLRTAAVWALVNLTFPSSPGAHGRVVKLRNAGITSQLKNMVNDPCLDVKVVTNLSIRLLFITLILTCHLKLYLILFSFV